MSRLPLQCLRPYLAASIRPKPQHAHVYSAVQRRCVQSAAAEAQPGPADVEKQKRLEQLVKGRPLAEYYPRMSSTPDVEAISVRDFNSKYESIQEAQAEVVSVLGRVRSTRLLGSKLMFLDIERDTGKLQVMIEAKRLVTADAGLEDVFKSFKKVARIGDWICTFE
jgi:lysyl-tRNA synthetase, class II